MNGYLPHNPLTIAVVFGLLATILLLPGLSLILHFGLFDMMAGLWRLLGADCHALFHAPLKSTSLREFWGRRWNLAFSQMAALAVFRPLKGVVGSQVATMAAFLFSGCLHELAISVPARAGYGLPLLYFVLHAVARIALTPIVRGGNVTRKVGASWCVTRTTSSSDSRAKRTQERAWMHCGIGCKRLDCNCTPRKRVCWSSAVPRPPAASVKVGAAARRLTYLASRIFAGRLDGTSGLSCGDARAAHGCAEHWRRSSSSFAAAGTIRLVKPVDGWQV